MSRPPGRRALATIPNALTLLRIVVAVAFPWTPQAWRLGAIVIAGLSDALDGFLARRLRTAGPTGALLDGIADKVFGVLVLGTLAYEGTIAWWQLALLLSRDIAVALIAVFVTVRREWWAFGRMSARWLGKVTTVAVFAFVIGLYAAPALAPALLWVAIGLSAASGVDYLVIGVRRHAGASPAIAGSAT